MTETLKKAIGVVGKAIVADNENRLDDALALYLKSFEWFGIVLKYEKNDKTVEMVRKKLKAYAKRAEEIKEQLESPVAETETEPRKGLENSIVSTSPNVKWDDVAGLEVAKAALKETVILPIRCPQLFKGKRKPWKGIVLYGPPGTGKSYLAKAVATEAKATFFSVSSSDLTSKWVGEGPKQVRKLFEMARANKPSIIFIDEIDSLCSSRENSSSESSKQIKNEFLVQLDGVGNDQTGVLLLGATNLPWTLDIGMRRRFQKKIYIPLPNERARIRVFEIHVGDTACSLKLKHFKRLAKLTEGYTGADISTVVAEALMQPIKKVQTATHFKQIDNMVTPCSSTDPNAFEATWMEVPGDKIHAPNVMYNDFLRAIDNTRPTVTEEDLVKYVDWTEKFGVNGK